jgi:cyclopropane fatty-acyl-phospholipid synthase-like methyltransferase
MAYEEKYFQSHISGWHAASFPKIKYFLETHLGQSKDLRILDLGCGDGFYGEVLREHACWLAGVDGSQEAVNSACEKGLYDEVAIGDLSSEDGLSILVEKNNYDIVFSTEVIEHIEDYLKMLKLARSALRPGGYLLLTTTAYYHFVFVAPLIQRSALSPRGLVEYFSGFWSVTQRQRFIQRFWDYTGGHYHGFSRRMLSKAVASTGFSLRSFQWMYAQQVFPTYPLLGEVARFSNRGPHWVALAKMTLLFANMLNWSVEKLELPAPNCLLAAQAI